MKPTEVKEILSLDTITRKSDRFVYLYNVMGMKPGVARTCEVESMADPLHFTGVIFFEGYFLL